MYMRVILPIVVALFAFAFSSSSFADGPCHPQTDSFNGFWGGGLVQVGQTIAGIPVLFTTRFSYKEIRYSPCDRGTPLLPPAIGEASMSIGVPILNNRRGGWLLHMAAKGQGSQKPGAPVSGTITGAPATAGHLNIWETAIPMIQLTGAASAAIAPQAQDFPMLIAYLGGVRIYPIHGKHTQANVGMTFGGSNVAINLIPSMALRASNLSIGRRVVAIGVELRSPISLLPGPTPISWRLWGALTIAVDEMDDGKGERSSTAGKSPRALDLVRSAREAAPPAQTAWEMTL